MIMLQIRWSALKPTRVLSLIYALLSEKVCQCRLLPYEATFKLLQKDILLDLSRFKTETICSACSIVLATFFGQAIHEKVLSQIHFREDKIEMSISSVGISMLSLYQGTSGLPWWIRAVIVLE